MLKYKVDYLNMVSISLVKCIEIGEGYVSAGGCRYVVGNGVDFFDTFDEAKSFAIGKQSEKVMAASARVRNEEIMLDILSVAEAF